MLTPSPLAPCSTLNCILATHPLLDHSDGDKAAPDRLFLPLPSSHPNFPSELHSTPPQQLLMSLYDTTSCEGHRRDVSHHTQHRARHTRSGARTRTENAGRSSGPFPFVRVRRREQRGDASDPHAAEPQPRLTPTTRPDPTTKPCASRCRPVTCHPCGARGRGQMGRRAANPTCAEPLPAARHGPSPGWTGTIHPEPPA